MCVAAGTGGKEAASPAKRTHSVGYHQACCNVLLLPCLVAPKGDEFSPKGAEKVGGQHFQREKETWSRSEYRVQVMLQLTTEGHNVVRRRISLLSVQHLQAEQTTAAAAVQRLMHNKVYQHQRGP